jgi:hypothetical protein
LRAPAMLGTPLKRRKQPECYMPMMRTLYFYPFIYPEIINQIINTNEIINNIFNIFFCNGKYRISGTPVIIIEEMNIPIAKKCYFAMNFFHFSPF